nr:G protein-coupled receptor [Proales similis]
MIRGAGESEANRQSGAIQGSRSAQSSSEPNSKAMNNSEVSNTVSAVIYLDYGARVLTLVLHVGYFGAVALRSTLRTRALLYLNQVNLIGLLLSINAAIYIGGLNPLEWSSGVVCQTSEMSWAILGFMRVWSLLLLGVYRYIAVFHLNLHHRWRSSVNLLAVPCISLWLTAVVLSFALKFALQTQPSTFMCTPGHTAVIQNAIVFFTIESVLLQLVPSLIAIILNTRMIVQMRKNKQRVESSNQVRAGLASITTFGARVHQEPAKKRRSQEIQLLIISVLIMLICLAVLLAGVFGEMVQDSAYELTLTISLVHHVLEALLPIVSLSFNPDLKLPFFGR